eukprot:gene46052-20412_t
MPPAIATAAAAVNATTRTPVVAEVKEERPRADAANNAAAGAAD